MERSGLSAFEIMVVGLAGAAAVVGGLVWGGAFVAAAATGGDWHATFSDALAAAGRLPSHLSDPARAWPPASSGALPGPVAYWAATSAVAGTGLVLAGGVARVALRSRVGTAPRRPLGVDARPRFANGRDLRPLAVARRHPGRFLLGRHGRTLLATESTPRGRRGAVPTLERSATRATPPARTRPVPATAEVAAQ